MTVYKVDSRNIVVYNITVLTFYGIIPPNFQNTQFLVKILHFLRIFLMGFICIGLLICQTIHLFLAFGGQIQELVTAAYVTLTNMTTGIKLYRVYQTRRRIMYLVDTMNIRVFQPRSQHQVGLLKSHIRLSKGVNLVFVVIGSMVLLFMSIYPYTMTGEPTLPLPAYIPYSTNSSPFFEMTYAFEVSGIVLGAIAGINADGLMIGFLIFICAQLAVLNDSIVNIRELSLIGAEREGDISRGVLGGTMNAMLVECVDQHRRISAFKSEVSSIFGYLTLTQFVISVLTLCTNLFELTMVTELNAQLFFLIFYLIFLLIQIFFVCYFGNEIISKNFQLTNSAYHSDWLNGSVNFRRNLIIFMTRSHIDMKYVAGNLFTLSLETFVKIVKSSFSYFAVLQHLGDSEE